MSRFSRCVSKILGLIQGRKNPHVRVENQCEGVHVWQPWVLPTPRLSLIQKINARLLETSLKRFCRKHSISNPIVWTRLPTPVVWEAIKGLEYYKLIYQSIDKFPEHPRIALSLRERYHASERLFNQNADLVFASARGLYEEKRLYNGNAHFLPNGVSASFAEQSTHRIGNDGNDQGPGVGLRRCAGDSYGHTTPLRVGRSASRR